MTRLAFAALFVIAACGGKGKSTDTTTAGSGGGSSQPAVMAKKISLSWGITPEGEMADVFLQVTDETGKQVSNAVGRYKGTCAVIKPAPEMNAITGVACTTAGGGTELHAVKRSDEIVVVQMGTNPGVTPDPMSREQVSTFKIPVGIAVEGAK